MHRGSQVLNVRRARQRFTLGRAASSLRIPRRSSSAAPSAARKSRRPRSNANSPLETAPMTGLLLGASAPPRASGGVDQRLLVFLQLARRPASRPDTPAPSDRPTCRPGQVYTVRRDCTDRPERNAVPRSAYANADLVESHSPKDAHRPGRTEIRFHGDAAGMMCEALVARREAVTFDAEAMAQ